jgi:hypothetical protein
MKIKADLKQFVNDKLESYVTSHIEAWYGHYVGMSKQEASYELDVNYDWRSEFENISDDLGRKLTENEENYIFKKYLKLFEQNFYESMQEGYKVQTGYYLR